MIHIKKIVVPCDFSHLAKNALNLALFLTESFNAKLTVVHARILFEDNPNLIAGEIESLKEYERRVDNIILKQMKEDTDKHEHRLNIKHEIIRGYSVAPAILNYVNTNDFDLVILGTHGHTSIEHFLLGSVAEKVIKYAPCPVITLRPNIQLMRAPRRILIPYDFSEYAKKSFQYAVNLAKKFKSVLDLLYVVDIDVHPALYAWGMRSVLQIIPDIEKKAKSDFKKIIKEANANDIKINTFFKEGKPHREIIKFARDKGHDLIIMATHALSGIDRLLLGSVTEKVIRSAPCAVLTLKMEEKEFVD
jgi:nucleotide-binding universal stress UspA family protein